MNPSRPAILALALALAGSGCTTIVRSSVASNGTAGNAMSSQLDQRAISDTGRFVAFGSEATNLVPNDTNDAADAFRHDNVTGATIRVSVTSTEGQIPGDSTALAISGDGNHVAFRTAAALEPADTNGLDDVYVRTISTGGTERVSIRPDGNPIVRPDTIGLVLRDTTLSYDGQVVAMLLTGLAPGAIYLRDRSTDVTTTNPVHAFALMLSNDGSTYVWNQGCPQGGPCQGVSVVQSTTDSSSEVIESDCGFTAYDVSATGQFVVGVRFQNSPQCDGPIGLMRWNRATKRFVRINAADEWLDPFVSISNSGRIVSVADDLGAVQVIDLATDTVQTAVGPRGELANASPGAALSGNGRYISFTAPDRLVPEDTDDHIDVFTKYSLRPEVHTVRPPVPSGTRRVVSVHGVAFLNPAAVAVAGPGVTVHSVTFEDARTLTIDVSVDAGVPAGTPAVVVTNGGGFGHADGFCTACFTIT